MIWLIFGTRPEAVKLGPVVKVLRERRIPHTVICTGQHTTLLDGMGLTPDLCLNVPSQNDPDAYVRDAVNALSDLADRPTRILVQGDTASAMAGARFASLNRLPLAHIEAGLRSFDESDPWPEETYRVQIDHLSDLRFAPTITSMGNLLAENLQHGSLLTGNTSVDALKATGITRTTVDPFVLITLHRREAFGQPMQDCLNRIGDLAAQYPTLTFAWLRHPNPEVAKLHTPPRVFTANPLPYTVTLQLVARATAVITDSGGLIEECATLGTPCLIARNTTERPESLAAGYAHLVSRDGAKLPSAFPKAIQTPLPPSTLFGSGHAAEAIVDALTETP